MNNGSSSSLSALLADIHTGDGSSFDQLQRQVDRIVLTRTQSSPPSPLLKSMATDVDAGPATASEALPFDEPFFNAALLKSLSKISPVGSPPDTEGRLLKAASDPSADAGLCQSLFEQMLSENAASHHAVICHLAMAGQDDPVREMMSNSVATGAFDQGYFGDWLSGVGEILEAMDVPLEQTTDGFGSWIQDVGSKISGAAKKVYQAVVAAAPLDTLAQFASAIKEMAGSMVVKLLDSAQDVAQLLRSAFSKGTDFIKNMLLSLLHAGWDMGKLFGKFANLADDLFKSLIGGLLAAGSDVSQRVLDWFTTAVGPMLELARTIYRRIEDAGHTFIDFLKSLIGNPSIEPLIRGIIGFAGKLFQGIGDAVESAAQFVVDLLERALAAHIHLLRHFAKAMEAIASPQAAKPQLLQAAADGVSIAGIVLAVLGILYAPTYLPFTLSILLLIFAPLLVEALMGILQTRQGKPSVTFDPSKLKVATGDPSAKYVVFSDLHRGTKLNQELGISYTSWNTALYASTLQAYFDAGYILVENGDAEDFWNDSTTILSIAQQAPGGVSLTIKQDLLGNIQADNAPVYQMLAKFIQANRFVKILGNHDMDLSTLDYQVGGAQPTLWDGLMIPARADGPSTSPVAGPTGTVSHIANRIDLGTRRATLVLHGHQVDDANSPETSGIGRAITTLGVFAGMLFGALGNLGNLFGDMGATDLQKAIQSAVSMYLNFAGPTPQDTWTKSMNDGHFTTPGAANDTARAAYEKAAEPTPSTAKMGLNCLSEQPMIKAAQAQNVNVVMGHTHQTKCFRIPNLNPPLVSADTPAFLNSGTGGMLEKVLTCIEIVGTQALVVYHAAANADAGTKTAVSNLSI